MLIAISARPVSKTPTPAVPATTAAKPQTYTMSASVPPGTVRPSSTKPTTTVSTPNTRPSTATNSTAPSTAPELVTDPIITW
jgi:hypothetical protein